MGPKGSLIEDGAHATLTFNHHSAARVWDAIATPEGLRGWLLCTCAEIEPRAGGRIELVSGPPAYHSTGKILVWDPPRVLEYEWNVAPVPEMPRGEQALFRYELTPDGDSTHLRVTYRRLTRQTAGGFLPGLHAFLDRLDAQLDGRPAPDWATRFAVLRTEYPEWSGNASPAGE